MHPTLVLSTAALLACAGAATAQTQPPSQPGATAPTTVVITQPEAVRSGSPQRDTLRKLMRPVSLDVTDKRLEDIIVFLRDFTGAELEPMWIDDRNTDGLDKERLVTIKVNNIPALTLFEKLLDQTRGDFGENTWQMSDTGAFQFGPKERLNKFRRVEIYDINDLTREVPDYTDVPLIDLQQALQASQQGGGGGGQGPFRDEQGENENRLRSRQERSQEVLTLIQSLVEPEQWTENGGSGGSIRLYQNSALIVNAPDYMHRGINGYPYWPAQNTVTTTVNNRRYVTLNGDTGQAKVTGFGQQDVSAVVGGQIINSRPGGGGR